MSLLFPYKLSKLIIDIAKNWGGKKIENLGAPDSGDDAKRHDSSVDGLVGVLTEDQHVIDAEALAAAWAGIDKQSFVNLLINGDFEVGDPPTGWYVFNSGIISRSTEQVKVGAYSLKYTSVADNWGLAGNFNVIPWSDYWKGRKVTLGEWLYASEANRVRFGINDGPTETHVWHPGDSTWYWLTVTHTVSATASRIWAQTIRVETGTSISAYADGAILVEGDSCPAFSPKPDQALICHHTAAYTISRHETGHIVHTNLGAGAAVTITLPQTVSAGFVCRFAVMTGGQQLRIDPGAAGAIYVNGAKQTDDKYIWADDEGESITLIADGNGDWISMYGVGTWGVEA